MTDTGSLHLPERPDLSRREAQIMEILYRRGSATAADVHERLPDPPGYSSVRKQLEILVERGHATHWRDGRRYVYAPVLPAEEASASALRSVVKTFFSGSASEAMAALLDDEDLALSGDELDRIQELAEQARRTGC